MRHCAAADSAPATHRAPPSRPSAARRELNPPGETLGNRYNLAGSREAGAGQARWMPRPNQTTAASSSRRQALPQDTPAIATSQVGQAASAAHLVPAQKFSTTQTRSPALVRRRLSPFPTALVFARNGQPGRQPHCGAGRPRPPIWSLAQKFSTTQTRSPALVRHRFSPFPTALVFARNGQPRRQPHSEPGLNRRCGAQQTAGRSRHRRANTHLPVR